VGPWCQRRPHRRSAKNGVVTLSGYVPSYWEKYAAEKAAKRVYGVMAVANELEVKLPGSSQRTDEDIAAACVNALKPSISIPSDKIKVVVSKGWVTLEGEVEWQYQKRAAENAVRYLTGVIGVSNLIAVKPHVSPTEIKSKIEDAFKRSAELDARRISVEVKPGDPARQRTLVGRERRGRAGGLGCSGHLPCREPHHHHAVTGRRGIVNLTTRGPGSTRSLCSLAYRCFLLSTHEDTAPKFTALVNGT
jgi:osmotically-inducible protein OsmY